MDHLDIHVHARRLFDVQGTKAAAETAHKARSFEEHGDVKEATIWRRIVAALREMRGPHQNERGQFDTTHRYGGEVGRQVAGGLA